MDISFDYYKVFYEVARCQNITQAALNLCLTQPTVTKYIHNLEDMLQCKLFNRSQKGVTLTDEGRILFRQINRPCQQMGRAEELLKEYMNSQSGKVSIGASELTMRFFLLPYIEQFQQRFPNVTVQIHSNSAPITASSLKAGENDFAVIISPIHEIMKELDLVHVMPVAEFQDIVIAGNRFSELQNRTLSLEELCMHPLVSMESGTTTRLFWDNLFEEQGLDLRPSIEVSSNDLISPTIWESALFPRNLPGTTCSTTACSSFT